jgi:hypothetical protein
MNIYYHSDGHKEIEAILAHGFIDKVRIAKSNRSPGVYVVDNPLKPEYPDKQLLEISLPEVIDISPWKFVPPPDRVVDYGEWVIPSSVLNQNAKLRLVTKTEWEQLWAKHQEARIKIVEAQAAQIVAETQEMVDQGLLEHAKDASGQPLYRDGQPVWRITPKGQELAKSHFGTL